MSTTRDITRAARPPRSVFVDFPNGNTTGKVHQPELTQSILGYAFDLLNHTDGEILRDLPYAWGDTDDWKDTVFAKVQTESGESKMVDDRTERFESPQYQSTADAQAATQSHDGETCLVCVGIDI